MYKGMNIPVDALNGLSTIESYGFVLEDHGDIRLPIMEKPFPCHFYNLRKQNI